MTTRSYLINLDRSPDRLLFMTEQARSIGFAFERIVAVDGAALSNEQIAPYQQNRGVRPLSAGEVGCWLSHRRAWRMIVERGDRWGIILEDDCRISPDFPRLMGELNWLPPAADLVRIEAWPSKKAKVSRWAVPIDGRMLHRLEGSLFGTAGYAISQEACTRLLADRDHAACSLPIDQYLYSTRSPVFGRLVTYVMIPALVIQESGLPASPGRGQLFGTLIGADRHRPSKIPFLRKLRQKLRNGPQQVKALFAARRVVDWR